ncbi:MAG: class I adenylate-forming enzyme family protein [Steroidobacteraceae bacterium]
MIIDAPHLFLPDVWSGHARWRPEKTALVVGDRRLTWAELNARTNRVGNGLARAGLAKGDKVAVLMNNGVEMVETMLGAVKGGFVVVPLSGLLKQESISMMIADSGARALFYSPEYLPLVAPVLDTLASGAWICVDPQRKDLHAYERWLKDASDEEPVVVRDPQDEFVIIYSSGTTGIPKGIVHTHHTRHHLSYAMAIELGMTEHAVALATTPLYANGTWLVMLPPLFVGATLVVMQRFTPAAFLETVERERVTHTFMVPPQFAAVLDAPEFDRADLSSLEVMLSGGAPFPIEVKRATLDKIGPGLYELYGCTEGIGTIIKPEKVLEKPMSVGLPVLGLSIAIIDEQSRELPRGQIGEIVGYGPGLMKGYHNRPDDTRAALWRDARGRSWLRTGDVGRLDDEGYLTVLDRKKDMIVSGGINVYAADLEQVIAGHQDVAEVTVIGIPHDRWGEAPLALVVARAGAPASESELTAWANERLAKHQRVVATEFRQSFPRNALGKVLKRELREPYWSRERSRRG